MVRVVLTPKQEQVTIQTQLLQSLKESGWDGEWSVNNKTIVLDVEKGVSLDKYIKTTPLDYSHALRLALSIGTQLATLSSDTILSKQKLGVLFFELKDIMVLDENWYLLTSHSKILPMDDKNQLELTKPIKFTGFLSPELENVTSLPFSTDQSCSYYSLALLCLQALHLDYNKEHDFLKLKGTKLYYLLERCLEKKPKNRRFLYI